jgi:hypothetical protein
MSDDAFLPPSQIAVGRIVGLAKVLGAHPRGVNYDIVTLCYVGKNEVDIRT